MAHRGSCAAIWTFVAPFPPGDLRSNPTGAYLGCAPCAPSEAEAFHNLTHQTASRSNATSVTRPPTTATLRRRVLAALDELKAHDIREIDVRGRTSIADLLIIASGTSSRHVKSIADEVVKFAKRAGMLPLGVEGEQEAEWVLVDLGDIIVHVMLPRIREFYGLERLWTVGDQSPEAESEAEAANAR